MAPVTENSLTTKAKIHPPTQNHPAAPIEQVVALRNKLRETVTQTNELLRLLKQQKKQSRLLASTLASLKELQKVAG